MAGDALEMPQCLIVHSILLDVIHELIVCNDILILVVIDGAPKADMLRICLVLFLMSGDIFHKFNMEVLPIILFIK